MTLTYADLNLRPLRKEDLPALNKITEEPEVWQNSQMRYQSPQGFQNSWLNPDKLFANPLKRNAFVLEKAGDIIGSSSLYDGNEKARFSKLGYTFYHPSYFGSYVNPACKLLLLTHAFEQLNLVRVMFTIDADNQRAVHALKKLGAPFEGILRKDKVRSDGSFRDTAVFAITNDDWPKCKASLSLGLKQLITP